MPMTSRRFALAAVAVVSLFVSLARPALADPHASSGIDQRPAPGFRSCRIEEVDEPGWCGSVAVPEDRRRAGGRSINLNIVMLPKLGSGRSKPPLFILQGGPGQAATDLASFYAETFAEARGSRDIVLIDQRGTGASTPLQCDRGGAPERLQAYLGGQFALDHLASCRARLERKAQLERYTTTDAMEDLDDVRSALGYSRLSLYGTSYGTRAAIVYLKRYPKRVESLILKGVTPLSEIIPLTFASASQRSLDLLFFDCAQDAACRAAYPDLAGNLRSAFGRLANGPVTVEVAGPPRQRLQLSREDFSLTLRSLLQSTSSAARVPLLLRQAAAGDFGPALEATLALRQAGAKGVFTGMQLSVICAEDAPFIASTAIAGDRSTFLGNIWVNDVVKACRIWPGRPVGRDFRQMPRSSVPTLLISGFTDPATPPSGAEEVSRHLTNSRHMVVRNGSHSFSGMKGCVDVVMTAFLNGTPPNKLDLNCADRVTRPAWEVVSR